MKKNRINLSVDRVKSIIDDNTPCSANELNRVIKELTDASVTPPNWLVLVLKIVAYAIGLFLAGVGTTATASCCFPNMF